MCPACAPWGCRGRGSGVGSGQHRVRTKSFCGRSVLSKAQQGSATRFLSSMRLIAEKSIGAADRRGARRCGGAVWALDGVSVRCRRGRPVLAHSWADCGWVSRARASDMPSAVPRADADGGCQLSAPAADAAGRRALRSTSVTVTRTASWSTGRRTSRTVPRCGSGRSGSRRSRSRSQTKALCRFYRAGSAVRASLMLANPTAVPSRGPLS